MHCLVAVVVGGGGGGGGGAAFRSCPFITCEQFSVTKFRVMFAACVVMLLVVGVVVSTRSAFMGCGNQAKVKLFLCVIKRHVMKAYEELET